MAKGYTQKDDIDYKETFSPIVMLKSIRILLSIVAHFNYEIWQMDVKTKSIWYANLYEANRKIHSKEPRAYGMQIEKVHLWT